MIASVLLVVAPDQASASDPCSPPIKPVACENTKTGTSPTVWDIDGSGDDTIQGYATDISVNVGQTVSFKVNTTASSYSIDIYRLGYYNGNGARKITSISPSASLPQSQPACVTDPSVSLVDCGTWNVSASWAVPSTAVSGVYFAKLTTPSGATSHITFVVRDDSSHADIAFKTSDATWEAYNTYGGWDFYSSAAGRAFKISYNRPFATRGANGGRDFLFSNEYPMIRFLERNGYDISYLTDVDADRAGSLIANHKVFLSVGHDEYWSYGERANVEAARDAGTSLAFFSGNEVFWRTRFENSVDGHNTDHRTLVCYKETWENAKTDPTNQWTGTYRDPRFSPPAIGGASPENALTGTFFMSLNDDLTMQVPAAQGKDRFWRNTSVATLTPGSTATLAPHTVGYESDEDVDNGFRPAGLIDLSTTTGATPGELLDYGNEVGNGTTTHHMTLYKAASGALVFGAGTVQWAWGLDSNHDTFFASTDPADSRMQQATVNLLADMGAQPNTLMTGMTAASKSTDTTGPTVVITTPLAGSTATNGSLVNVSGTATDVGGVVAGVEYSTDAGATWHPANGTTSWSFSYYAFGDPSTSVQVRAVDDSANIGTASTRSVTVTGDTSLFGLRTPGTPASTDTSAVELGVKIVPQTDGYINGIRFYKGSGNTGTHVGSLWSAGGNLLATGTFSGESATGWQTLTFSSGVAVVAGTTYVVSYTAPSGHYAADSEFFVYSGYNASPLSAPRSYDAGGNGVYGLPGHFPTSSYQAANYYVDVLFRTSTSTPPSVTSVSPVPGAKYVATSTAPTATFTKQINPATLAFTVKDSGNHAVSGSAAYNSTSKTATFTPTAALAAGVTYTASVSASDTNGNAMPAPMTWSFTTDPGNTTIYTLLPSGGTPGSSSINDPNSVSVGVKFTPASDGQVVGIRFYKGVGNVGTHTGSVWSPSGALLATATFQSETDSGWQIVYFASPVAVSAGSTYTASYYAPTGHYAADGGYFASGYSNPPLSAPAGSNGVYTYGSDTLPTNSYNSANYWVDPLFVIPPPAPQPPAVASMTPVPNALYQPTSTHPTATFTKAIDTSTLTFTLKDSGNNTVAGSVAYNSGTLTATFTPSAALTAGASYTATVNASDTSGLAMTSPVSWTFTTDPGSTTVNTLFAANATPGSTSIADPNNLSLGVKFTPASNGHVIGIRFYKGAGNTGTHTGSLWSPTGTLLATATFVGETDSGWQTVYFASPVAVTAGSTYTASYYAPNGHYAADGGYFASGYSNPPLSAPSGGNGVYLYGSDALPVNSYNSANYWVDPLYTVG